MQHSRKTLRIVMAEYYVFGRSLHAEGNQRELMALARHGHKVTYLGARMLRSKMTVATIPGFKLETVSLRKTTPLLSLLFYELMVVFHFLASINRYDAVILREPPMLALFPLLTIQRLFRRSPIMFLRISSNPVETGGWLKSLALAFEYALSIKLSSVLFDKIFFISPMLAESDSQEFGIPRIKVAVWPSSVDTDVFNPYLIGDRARRLRTELGLSGRLAIIHHGVLTRARGIMEMVQAFKILKDKSTRATLILLGDGPARKDVCRYVRANDLAEFVQVRGPVDYQQVPLYLAACDVELIPLPDHPWWRYQCPFKLIESLAMNRPLIVSDIPAHRSIIGNAPVALYLKGTTANEIADGVRAFIKTKNSLNPALGREIAAEFSAERIAIMLEREILSAINKRRAR